MSSAVPIRERNDANANTNRCQRIACLHDKHLLVGYHFLDESCSLPHHIVPQWIGNEIVGISTTVVVDIERSGRFAGRGSQTKPNYTQNTQNRTSPHAASTAVRRGPQK